MSVLALANGALKWYYADIKNGPDGAANSTWPYPTRFTRDEAT